MPLVGWRIKIGKREEEYTLEEAREIAQKQGHFHRYPLPMLRALEDAPRDIERISPSGAGYCIRKPFIMRDYDYYLDPEKLWAAFQGSSIHLLISEANEDIEHVYNEEEVSSVFRVPLPDGTWVEIPVAGTIDYFDPTVGDLVDYKTVGWFARNYGNGRVTRETPSEENSLQVNIYKWLLEEKGHEVKNLYVWYVKRGDDGNNPRKFVSAPQMPPEDILLALIELGMPIAEAIHNGTYPAPIPEDDEDRNWECRYCPVMEICRKLEKEGK